MLRNLEKNYFLGPECYLPVTLYQKDCVLLQVRYTVWFV
jgi:hypothetical protein